MLKELMVGPLFESFYFYRLGYEQFGISRKGAEDTSDQHCTIFYDKDKVELLEGGTFWLSESPSVPGSMSWGSTAPCTATWAISFRSVYFTLLFIFIFVLLGVGILTLEKSKTYSWPSKH